ncbi:MAG: hypothetical protein V7760_01155 [Marinobacter sp.]
MHSKPLVFSISLLAGFYTATTQTDPLNTDISAVLDGFYKQQDTALSNRGKGFGLGHTELSLAAPIDDLFKGRVTAIVEEHDGETELRLEEAFLQTSGLQLNLGLKAGRFLSHVGYLNSQHLHQDSFVERPAAYRAMLGSHYFDDGARLLALIGLTSMPARSVINIFACEPEWAALASTLVPDARITSATTAFQDPHYIEARPGLIAAARNADLVLCTGAELEAGWLPVLLHI